MISVGSNHQLFDPRIQNVDHSIMRFAGFTFGFATGNDFQANVGNESRQADEESVKVCPRLHSFAKCHPHQYAAEEENAAAADQNHFTIPIQAVYILQFGMHLC